MGDKSSENTPLIVRSETGVEKIILNETLHCYKCGYVLLSLEPALGDAIQAKCRSRECLSINYFVMFHGKPKLLKKRILKKMEKAGLNPPKIWYTMTVDN